jgi:hypothetical protein
MSIVSKTDLAAMLERFIGDAPGCGDYEWDDFTSVRTTPELEPYRQRLLQEENSPPGNEREVRQIIAELRADA